MTNQPVIKRNKLKIPPGQCMACGGDGGELVADYVDMDDRYYPFKFLNCPCCDGNGKNCPRCWTKPIK
ncbi:MAG: hypothetical protein HEQ35_08485 [Gloeotrichia echinulata IR180]|jgi:hypothetical protein|nr:hypothetical protein [Gloeotrichia echinulata DEX184]